MFKIPAIVFILLLLLFQNIAAIEYKIYPDKKVEVTQKDIDAIKKYFIDTLNFYISEEGARKIAYENRILANEYIKSKLFKKDRAYNKIAIEKLFADNYVKYLQETVSIPESVLKSYYLDHLSQYKKSDKVNLDIYHFKDFDTALHFYKSGTPQNTNNGKKKSIGWLSIEKLNKVLRGHIKKGQKGYFLPPLLRDKGVDVVFVKDYKKAEGYKSFSEVKSEIRKHLYKKTFSNKRKEILQKLTHDNE